MLGIKRSFIDKRKESRELKVSKQTEIISSSIG